MVPLALTMGDPAGIGPEITQAAWARLRREGPAFCVMGDPSLYGAIPLRICSPETLAEAIAGFDEALPVLPVRLAEAARPGQPDPANAAAILESIRTAVALTQAGHCAAVVTNPINKAVLQAAGFQHPGHTEFLAELTGHAGCEVMMLACPQLRVVPVTIHVSLARAIAQLSEAGIVRVAMTTAAALRADFGIAAPRLAVAGLNPHAGENGLMGDEEAHIIAPAIAALRRAGVDASGPWPPDTMFTPAARARYDAAICQYHDQALIPLKTLDMDGGVNITLGIGLVRTSPDHGTAYDIAGQGVAAPDSLVAALRQAQQMAAVRATAAGRAEIPAPMRG